MNIYLNLLKKDTIVIISNKFKPPGFKERGGIVASSHKWKKGKKKQKKQKRNKKETKKKQKKTKKKQKKQKRNKKETKETKKKETLKVT